MAGMTGKKPRRYTLAQIDTREELVDLLNASNEMDWENQHLENGDDVLRIIENAAGIPIAALLDGTMVAVPSEPTKAMCLAGYESPDDGDVPAEIWDGDLHLAQAIFEMAPAYRAMLAAVKDDHKP